MNTTKFIYLFFLTASFNFTLQSQVIEVEGILTENTTWSADTVIVLENIIVPLGITLTIEPNTVVQGKQTTHLQIEGSLSAKGTIAEPILFTAIDTTGFMDTFSIAGTWGGIHFINLNDHTDSSVLDYCIVEYGGAFDDDYFAEKVLNHGGGIYIENSTKLRISNSIIQKNKVRIGGGGIYMKDYSFPHIVNNVIRNNITQSHGGGIHVDHEDCAPFIEKNLIIENYTFNVSSNNFATGNGGGIAIYSSSLEYHTLIYQNIISNNFCVGGAFYESSWGTKFLSNIVCNNIGSAIANGHQLSESYYVNNTIVNNHALLGNAIMSNSDHLNIYNNIIQNNWRFYSYSSLEDEISNITLTNEAQGNIKYNNFGQIDMAFGDSISDNIDIEPMFVSPSAGIGHESEGYLSDWSLLEGDAGIDAGSMDADILALLPDEDAYGNPRISGDAVDIGAVEYQMTVSVEEDFNNDGDVAIYPNPFSAVIWIENKSREELMVILTNMEGRQMMSNNIEQGQIRQLNTQNLPAGGYVCEIKNKSGEKLMVRKVIKN